MTEKEICVKQLEDVLKAVEQAMKDIQAGNYDEASAILDQLKIGPAIEQSAREPFNRKAS